MLKMNGFMVFALALAGAGATGCAQNAKDSGAPADAAKTGAAAAPAGADAEKPAAPTGPCPDYAAAICEKAGAQSATCAAMKEATGIMPPAACKAASADMAFTVKALAEMRKSCDELATKLCADLGEETESCKLVKEKTPSFPPDRCKSMMGQYDKVLAELKAQEAKNKPLDAAQQAALAKDAKLAAGPENAPVTVVEFSDFECPYCSRGADALNEIKKKYPKDVRIVFRQFPLSFHKNAHLAAQAAAAAGEQGKFWQYHDLLFKNQRALTRADLEKYAKEVGLNMAKFNKALDEKTHAESVDADMKLGGTVAVQGTPTMFVNGKRVANPTDAAAVSKAIDQALADSKK